MIFLWLQLLTIGAFQNFVNLKTTKAPEKMLGTELGDFKFWGLR